MNGSLFSTETMDPRGTDKTVALTLSQLTQKIKGVLSRDLSAPQWIVAEVSGLKHTDSGMFMDLVEKSNQEIIAKVRATVWRSYLPSVYDFEAATGQKFTSGIEVMLQVSLSFHTVYGLSVSIMAINSSYTLGNIELQRRATLERLVREAGVTLSNGTYTSKNHGLVLPIAIKRIALVGAVGSDGHRDFMDELIGNPFGYRYSVSQFNSRVQGHRSEEEILRALRDIFHRAGEFDVVVIVRGGGSDIDLATFDNFNVAKGCALFPIPVLTGIGHTRNESICDLMAFRALKTPTKVAQEIIDHNASLEGAVDVLLDKVIKTAREQLLAKERDLSGLAQRVFSYAINRIDSVEGKVLDLTRNIFQRVIVQSDETMRIIESQLKVFDLYDPSHVLKRGYALVTNDKGEPVSSPETVGEGEVIEIEFYSGKMKANVNKTSNNNE